MPIITKEEVTAILRIDSIADSTEWDDYITAVIPVVQDWIIEYCKNYFISDLVIIEDDKGISFTVNNILDSSSEFVTKKFQKGEVRIFDSANNDGIFTVTDVAVGSLTVTETAIVEAAGIAITIAQINWPEGIKLPTAQLIGYILNVSSLNTKEDSRPVSESFMNYSVNSGVLVNTTSFPKYLTAGFSGWVEERTVGKVKFM